MDNDYIDAAVLITALGLFAVLLALGLDNWPLVVQAVGDFLN